MSHTPWKNMRPLVDPTGRSVERQMAYVDGYLLHIQDVFRDLAALMAALPEGATPQLLARQLRQQLSKSQHESNETMRTLRRMYDQIPHPEGEQ